ncbi:MAG TPA: RlmI/RlmK family 23S rRNA methyltransferase, partial [Rhodospirillales bacterium]
MTAADPLPVVRLKAGSRKRFRAGCPWTYSNEIAMDAQAKQIPPGALVRMQAANGEPLGLAMFNPKTLIAARLIGRDIKAAVDAGFIAGRLEAALKLREKIYPGGCYRLIHAEADG